MPLIHCTTSVYVPDAETHKTDATWISDLLALGLIRSRFVPPAPIHERRDLGVELEVKKVA